MKAPQTKKGGGPEEKKGGLMFRKRENKGRDEFFGKDKN